MRAHLIAIVAGVAATLGTTSADGARRSPPREELRAPAPRVPATPFVENAGQWGGDVSFAAVGGERTVVLGAHAMTLVQTSAARRVAVEYAFDGARGVRPRGEAPTRAKHHYFHGSSTAHHARTFWSVVYDGAWPGVDLRFDARPAAVEYSLIVHPGAEASAARFRVSGATRVERTAGGELAVTSAAETVTHSRPVAWQEMDGVREHVDVAFEVGSSGDDGAWTYGFALGAHDPSRTVVVDPFFWFDQFRQGGHPRDIALGAQGDVYVAGSSSDVSDVRANGGSSDTTLSGARDAWIARPDAGGELVWATFLGGSTGDSPDVEEALTIGVADDGTVVACGRSNAATFPTTGVPQLYVDFTPNLDNTWVARLSADGANAGLSAVAALLGGRAAQQGAKAEAAS